MYGMYMKRVPTSEFRARLSRYIKEVNETGDPVLITEYNIPVAMLCPRPEITEHVVVPEEAASRTRA